MGQIARNINLIEVVQAYNDKLDKIPEMLNALKTSSQELQNTCSMMGAYGGQLYRDFMPDEKHLLTCLKRSAWQFVYDKANIKNIAPKTHIKHFENLIESPPDFDLENIKSVFGEYVANPRAMQLKAFAEIFCNLDPYYKSHDNMKIGVKGLPKRIIISGCTSSSWSYGWEKVADVINCLMRYRGDYSKCVDKWQSKACLEYPNGYEGLTFKHYANGNCHIIFDKQALKDINLALAEYYGDVLPDAYEHTDKKQTSAEVSKDLQFYRTPYKAVEFLMGKILLREGMTVLEPSCGDGAILEGLRKLSKAQKSSIDIKGIEFDLSRAEECRMKGFSVMCANFLEWKWHYKFDLIVMNPPFYGTHYAKHIDKAYEHLQDGGEIYAILPSTAKLNHGIIDKKYKVSWQDMPLGSFSESGTNINTMIAIIIK